MLPIILAIRDEDDRDFVTKVYKKYEYNIYNKARYYLSSEHDVKDCVQEVIATFIEYVDQCREWKEDHIKNFLMKCIRCVAINKYNENARRYSKEISVSELEDEGYIDIPDNDESVEQWIISEENVRRIAKMIEEMDPLYGDLLYLKSFLGMKNTEIAKKLGIPVNTVNQRIARAKNILEREEGKEIDEMLKK